MRNSRALGAVDTALMTVGLLLSLSFAATATTFYVDVNNPAPAAPYTNWVTAATNIQDAVDAAAAGDEVVVTDGVYQTGGRLASRTSTTNRVVVDKTVTVRSVNGSAVTVIQGQPAGSGGNGPGPMRCAYLTSGAVLAGFTLTNGATGQNENGGGVVCASAEALLTNCILVGNSAYNGGGAYQGTLNNCTLTGNSSLNLGIGSGWGGGGANGATLNNCTLTGNSAGGGGGGASGGTLNNCTLIGNSAFGFYGDGGGALLATLNNCALISNSAIGTQGHGGGTVGGTLNNCTLIGNSASSYGGGANAATLNNCIVYYNTAPSGSNYDGGTLNYCCTSPLPSGGVGNTNVEPHLASASHLSAGSPCRAAGNTAYATGVDIDGEAWANPPSIGCDEYVTGAVTGSLSVAIGVFSTNTVPGVALVFTAMTQGPTSASQWDFGNGTLFTNQVIASHAWAALGDYPVVLTAYDDTYPDGVSATVTVHVVEQVVHYVSMNNATPVPPYTSWATAAANIQDAIDAVYTAPNAVVLVSNGLYQAGQPWRLVAYGRATNQVVLMDKPIIVRSVNGPAVTVLLGRKGGQGWNNGPVRCAYLTDGAVLSGFTLTNGAAADFGGGVNGAPYFGLHGPVVSAVVTNCTLINNYAAWDGGGAYYCVLNNCLVISNSASFDGGGTERGTLNNCTLTGNVAQDGGGADNSTLNNCMVISNSANNYGGGAYQGTLNNCTLAGNRAIVAGYGGGGAYSATLNNCTLSGNSATSSYGGGADSGTLNNCTLSGNSASVGGGAYAATLNNCIVYYNSALFFGPNYVGGLLAYCCTTPQYGVGSITNAPLFVDLTNNNLRLQSNSPCINAGLNSYAPGLTDLDGSPRIVGGTVDMGAYECQSPALLDYYLWLQSYGLPTAASAVYADSDGDGLNNWQEWLAGTSPTNAASALRLQLPVSVPGNVTLTWSSVTNRTYFVQRATSLVTPPTFSLLQTNLPGLPDTTSFTDTNPPPSGPAFYRVGVQP